MCIFSGEVTRVSATNIFVKDRGNGMHALVYSMVVDFRDPVAMVLPVPTLIGSGDEALKFIDLSGCPNFFKELDMLFPSAAARSAMMSFSVGKSVSPLVVHDVGDYEASYVPSMNEFRRLDERFRLDDKIWGRLPDYSNCGFAVFQLKRLGSGGGRKFHPMAFEYPPENLDQLFFPTTHVHDGGDVPGEAHFDHSLYIQEGGKFRSTDVSFSSLGWVDADDLPPWSFYNHTHGLVSPDKTIYRIRLFGTFPNADRLIATNGAISSNQLREEPATVEQVVGSAIGIAEAMLHCTNCGAERQLDHKFCGQCGTKFK